MKINAQLPLQQALTTNYRKQDNFANWLPSPTHGIKGDDYYRQHQEDLQSSALSFNAITYQADNKASLSEATNPTVIQTSPITATIAPLIAAYEHQETCLWPKESAIIANQAPVIADLLLPILSKITPYADNLAKPLMTEKMSPPITIKTLRQHAAISSSHQLFLSGNEAELALNTYPLSKQNAQDLQALIKQELAAKGYRLNKLIINGVKQ